MSSLKELAETRAGLSADAIDHLQALVSDWQILADLSFADLLLFCRDVEGDELVVVAQMRPYTAQTVYQEDLVGTVVPSVERPSVVIAFDERRIVRETDPDWSKGVPVREEAIPVTYDGQIVAVVSREANLATVRAPSALELTYLQTADELAQMVSDGTFPFPGEDPERELAPRVGDGLMRVEADGTVTYASPNAISAYRRLGVVDNIVGTHLSDFDLDDAAVCEALADGEPLESEVEARGAVVLRRLVPLIGRQGEVLGGLILMREVTELRRHERLLLYKDATIREIHHRVKNNLQTVASLLRLQSRRMHSDEARDALAESVRRITSIALVHETLSQESRQRVSFDMVAHRLVEVLGGNLAMPEQRVKMTVGGYGGELPAEVATPLALVLSELLQNSVQHAFPDGGAGGAVNVQLQRGPASLVMIVRDDGVGVPATWSLDDDAHLGLQIAGMLVQTELGGSLTVAPALPHGTEARAELPLPATS